MSRRFRRMHSWLRSSPVLFVALFVALTSSGCPAEGVGDPCEFENIPLGGFLVEEAYLETSSAQCRTRVCLVYQLAGFPNRDDAEYLACEEALPDRRCATPTETLAAEYCTCRCGGTGSSTTCECPDDYTCTSVLELGGEGVRGNYCVLTTTLPMN